MNGQRRKNIICFILFGLLHTYLFVFGVVDEKELYSVWNLFACFKLPDDDDDDVSSALFRAVLLQKPPHSWLAWMVGVAWEYRENEHFQAPQPPRSGVETHRVVAVVVVGSQKKEYYILLNSA